MSTDVVLPGLNCGLCGYPTCDEFSAELALHPELLERCVNRSNRKTGDGSPSPAARSFSIITEDEPLTFRDREDREVDFYVDTFKEDTRAARGHYLVRWHACGGTAEDCQRRYSLGTASRRIVRLSRSSHRRSHECRCGIGRHHMVYRRPASIADGRVQERRPLQRPGVRRGRAARSVARARTQARDEGITFFPVFA